MKTGLLREGKKSAGVSNPRVGCCQRSRTSAPVTRPVPELYLWLKEQAHLIAFDGMAQLAQQRELGRAPRV